MLDSDFWRELAIAFGHHVAPYDFGAIRHYSLIRGIESTPNWQLLGSDDAVAEFMALAHRAASKIATSLVSDLSIAWLETLWKEATTGPIRQGIPVVETNESTGTMRLQGKIDKVLRASSTLCRKFESKALQAEFEEKQRDNPRNWTQFRQRIEAFESIKEVRDAPPYRISEAVVRNIIADIDGIKPEDVTWKRIAFEIAGLGGPNRRHIEVVPTPPPESPPTPEGEKSGAQSEPSPAKQPQVEKPKVMPEATGVAAETVAAQIQRLRMECNWTEEKLAERTGFNVRTVRRHLSGDSIPHLGNIAVYEQAFSKVLKKQIVISKMP